MNSALTRLSHRGVSLKSATGLSVVSEASETTCGSASSELMRGPLEVSGGAKRGKNFVGCSSCVLLLRDGDEGSRRTGQGGPQVAAHRVGRQPDDVVGHL